ncbi:unnamed protein product [Prunus armeniaca]
MGFWVLRKEGVCCGLGGGGRRGFSRRGGLRVGERWLSGIYTGKGVGCRLQVGDRCESGGWVDLVRLGRDG